jgi:hypothetical protein
MLVAVSVLSVVITESRQRAAQVNRRLGQYNFGGSFRGSILPAQKLQHLKGSVACAVTRLAMLVAVSVLSVVILPTGNRLAQVNTEGSWTAQLWWILSKYTSCRRRSSQHLEGSVACAVTRLAMLSSIVIVGSYHEKATGCKSTRKGLGQHKLWWILSGYTSFSTRNAASDGR